MTQIDTNTAKFVLQIAQGSSISSAAKKARISRSTAHRLLDRKDIQDEICRCRRRYLDEAMGKLSSVTAKAVNELVVLMHDACPRVRLSAIRLLFDSYLKVSERESLERRLEYLEEKAVLNGSVKPN